MVEYSLLIKIKTVFNLIAKSSLFLILLLGILLMMIDLLYISKQSKKTKITYSLISLIVIILFIYSYLDSVVDILDTLAKNLVAMVYFPTVLEYIATLLLSLIIFAYSIFSKKINHILKRINIFSFVINAFIFFLILDELTRSEVDLNNKISIYTNSNLMILLELSLFIFVVWMIGLFLYKLIKNLTPNKKDNSSVNLNFYDEPIVTETKELRNETSIPEPKIQQVVMEKKNESEMFTVEEYKQMRSLLDKIKENQDR